MKSSTYNRTAFALALAGLLFSGYLSGVKLFTASCAFNEPCPYFLGYPACWYGFAMYLAMFVVSALALRSIVSAKKLAATNLIISFLGIMFAGYFTVPEIKLLASGAETNYSLGLPTCAFGLIFFIVIFVLSCVYIVKNRPAQYFPILK